MTITIPHKQMVSKFCEKLDDDALFTGAVNWIKFDKDRGLIGNNFDGQGFINGFLGQNNALEGKRVCIFGAGGAAVAITSALVDINIKSLKIVNRDVNKAFNLKDKLNTKQKSIRVDVSGTDDYVLSDCDVIINATSLGLKKNDKIPIDLDKTSKNSIIADIELGVSRNAIAGKAHRLGLPKRNSPISKSGEPSKKQDVSSNETKKELPLKILLRTVEWSRNRCCWPKGDPKLPGFSFCGTVIVPGRPYCEEHSNLAYTNTRES